MAVPAGTQLRYNIVGDREDLADAIYRISPEDTIFLSMIGRGKADSTFHEWQTDALAAPDGDNAQLEGDDAAFSTPTPTVRVGNYTQISTKTLATSGSTLALNLAGRRSEEALQQAKRAAELKLDMETILLRNQAANAGGSAVPRRLAGLPVWLQTNVDFGATGANSGHTSGAPTSARTDGTARPFTKDMLDGVMQSMWTEGGKPKVLMVGAFNKTVVSGFAGIATHTVDVTRAAPTFLVNAIDVYVNDFGKVRVVANRLQRAIDAWILDPSLLSVRYFRPFKVEALAKTGDSRKKMMVVEYTLRVNQEAGLGLVTDLTTA